MQNCCNRIEIKIKKLSLQGTYKIKSLIDWVSICQISGTSPMLRELELNLKVVFNSWQDGLKSRRYRGTKRSMSCFSQRRKYSLSIENEEQVSRGICRLPQISIWMQATDVTMLEAILGIIAESIVYKRMRSYLSYSTVISPVWIFIQLYTQ